MSVPNIIRLNIQPQVQVQVQVQVETLDIHDHVPIDSPDFQHFTWKRNLDAEKIVLEGVNHNDVPSRILDDLEKAGINPLPSVKQLNNKIAYLRKHLENNMKKDITTSGELKDALDELIAIPEDDHEAFVNDYKIVILPCENKARFWNHNTSLKTV